MEWDLLGVALGILVAAQTAGTFLPTGNLTTPRSFHTAILLDDGSVLMASGGTIERYEPTTPTTGTFSAVEDFHQASDSETLLDDGRVLIVLNLAFTGPIPIETKSVLFDPVSRTVTETGSMVHPQLGDRSVLLRSGKVLFVGGVTKLPTNGPATLAKPELYDPSTGTFSLTGAYATTGSTFYVSGGPDISAVSPLADGRVLLAGEPTSELYDPDTGTFSLTGSMTTPCSLGGRPEYIAGRTATLLTSGKVLVTGGEHEDCGRFADAELYDPATGAFTAAGEMTRPRDNHTATLLPDGTVLIAGGETDFCTASGCSFAGTDASAESYDPSAGRFSAVGIMTARRAGHTATLLENGTVLIAGGYCYLGIGQPCGTFDSAEIYTPPVLVPAPQLLSMSGDGRGQGAIIRAGTRQPMASRPTIAGEVVTWINPASAGELLEIYCASLGDGLTRLLPDVRIGGRRAEVLSARHVPGRSNVTQVSVRVPAGVAAGPAVPVRLVYLGRTSNEVTIGVQ